MLITKAARRLTTAKHSMVVVDTTVHTIARELAIARVSLTTRSMWTTKAALLSITARLPTVDAIKTVFLTAPEYPIVHATQAMP